MKKVIYLKTVFIFMLFLCLFSVLILIIKKSNLENKEIENNKITEQILENISMEKDAVNMKFQDDCIGIIKIPSIDVQALIYQGTSQEILKYWVGHFENTSTWERKYSTCITQ